MTVVKNVRGIIRGRTIELEADLRLPDGQPVRVSVATDVIPDRPRSIDQLPAFGALADLGDEVDEFDEWCRQQRQRDLASESRKP